MSPPAPRPLYTAADLHPAYVLRYGWTGWPSGAPCPTAVLGTALTAVAGEWERDGLRLLESSCSPKQLLLTLSAQPQISPITLAARVKGRLQHHCRLAGRSVAFSRKVAIRSIGNNNREAVEGYVAQQVAREPFADERFRAVLERLAVVRPDVNLSQPTESRSGRYWYNLHLVLVTAERYRMGDEAMLTTIRAGCLRICDKKRYTLSTLAVMPDHVHLALRGDIESSPQEIALAFLNNLAYLVGQRPIWQSGYYAGTFSEYDMGAVRNSGQRRTS